MAARPIRIAVIGAGHVGGALCRSLTDPRQRAQWSEQVGAPLELVAVAVRDGGRDRGDLGAPVVVGAAAVLDHDPDVVVELAGGIDDVRPAIEAALDRSMAVVTANKALVASCGTALAARAAAAKTDLLFEAAVGGAIPIVRALRTSLAGERIERVLGIVNGTTNYVLTEMAEGGATYAAALERAQTQGFAERDPSADVRGTDAAAKIAILSALAFGTPLDGAAVPHEGIDGVTADDVAFAARHGHVIKLLAIAERVGEHAVSRRVHPAMVPRAHPLAAVGGAYNAVFVEGASAGPLMWLGQGAGGLPTSSAVVGDLLTAARNRAEGRHERPLAIDGAAEAFPPGELQSVFYLSLDVADRPGVLAAVAGVFGEHGVSIKSMEQSGFGDEARLTFLTHRTIEADFAATVEDLATLDVVDRVGSRIRVLGEGPS